MPEYTFHVLASVTVRAETPDEACQELINACLRQSEDVDYSGASVYLPLDEAVQANPIEIYPEHTPQP